MTDMQNEETTPMAESIPSVDSVVDVLKSFKETSPLEPDAEIDPDADVDDKVQETETEKNEEVVWPPPDWKDTFVVPKDYLLMLINVVPNVLTELDHDNDESVKYAGNHKVPVVFFSHDTKKTKFDEGEWDPKDWRLHPAPDLPGLAKGIYVHTQTMSQLKAIEQVFPVLGLVWHPVPHIQTPNIFVIREVYVMPGATINQGMVGDKPCLVCKKGATRSCFACESAIFCSQMCADHASQSGQHTVVDCRMAMRKKVEGDAVRARERIIERHQQIEKDREARNERLKIQDAKKDETDKYKDKKRARLRLESALARKQLGMEPSHHLVDQEAAVQKHELESIAVIQQSSIPSDPSEPLVSSEPEIETIVI